MTEEIFLYCIGIVIFTYMFLRYFIKVAHRFGFMDEPNDRSSHKEPIPRGAGLVMGLMFLSSLIIFQTELFIKLIYPMIALFVVLACGIVDDLKEISSKIKFLFIIIASFILVYDSYVIDNIGNYFGYTFSLGFLSIPFTVFAIVGFTNAQNLIDGLDGLAGGIASVILSSLFIVGLIHEDTLLIVLPSFMLSILFAFLLLNWNPAKVFMGDSGSLFLGLLIAFLSIYALRYVTPTSVFFLAAIPILDTMIVFRRRLQRGQSPFKADKNHMHHILQNAKGDVQFTVRTLIMIQLSFCLIFLQISSSMDILNLILFGVLYLIFFNLFDPRVRRRVENKPKKSFIYMKKKRILNNLKRNKRIKDV